MRHAVTCTIGVALATPARADHDHGAHHDASSSGIVASLGVIAARYDSLLYDGDYQGLDAGTRWSRGRFAAGATIVLYRIRRNGLADHGAGDAMIDAAATVIARPTMIAGVAVAVMVPTGNAELGLGMGHAMVMPAAWWIWHPARGSASLSIGYGRGIGDESVHAEHGGGAGWPLVEPMAFSELSLGGRADVAVASGLRLGARVDVAIPLPRDDGDVRLSGGPRIAWTEGRVETVVELAAGFAGHPFEYRGSIATSYRF